MVHVTDMFTTLLGFAGCEAPRDRLIDGVDQGAFFLGEQETIEPRCLHGVAQRRTACGQMEGLQDQLQAPAALSRSGIAARLRPHHPSQEDPKEREAVNQRYVRWWVMQHAHRIVRDFENSVKKEELIPPGRRSRLRSEVIGAARTRD